MGKEEFLQKILTGTGALIQDSHIIYTSGRHGSAYVNKDAVYPHTEKMFLVCWEIAQRFLHDNVEAVIAPAIGGVVLSQWTAYHLSRTTRDEVLGVYAEKSADGGFAIKRGYDKLIRSKRILVVEDILTTGGSVKKVIEAVRQAGGNVIGLGALVNRGGVKSEDVGNPPKFESLLNLTLPSWEAENCPLCKENIPINTDVGKGKEFLKARTI